MDKVENFDEESKIHYLFKDKSQKQVHNLEKKHKGLSSVNEEVLKLNPTLPIYFIRPNSLKKSAQFFLENFQTPRLTSRVLYSVKSNPEPVVLKHLFASGISQFDVASFSEIKLINELFGKKAKMYFMHPIKAREAIHAAYFTHEIRDFSLDSFDELKKILEVTNNAKDLNLHVRLAIPNSHSAIDLTGKFGILPSESISLLRKVKTVAKKTGICFHVGSQCMEPSQYRASLEIVKDILEQSKVKIDVLDIGGGFPSSYPGMIPVHLDAYFDEIFDTINKMNLGKNCEIWCEPGRALVAESASLLVRVEGKKQNMLYLNDGTYGGLFDAGSLNFIYPTRAIRVKEDSEELLQSYVPFGFYGPTCDSLDTMKGPFYLPENIKEGDYIEIGQLGAYSKGLRTNFNGFGEVIQIEVRDEPLKSVYQSKDNLKISQSKQNLS